MRKFPFLLCSIIVLKLQAQQLYFPQSAYADSTSYPAAISALAEKTIPLFNNVNKQAYYDGLFRLYFAKNDYHSVQKFLDSFDVELKLDTKVAGFHYRTYSIAALADKGNSPVIFETEYIKAFTNIFNTRTEPGKDQIRTYFKGDDPEGDKKNFLNLLSKQKATGKDSIKLSDAVTLIRTYNFWKVYSKTLLLAKKQLETIDAAELANRESKLLGLDEGAVLSPMAKTFITNVTVLDVENRKLIPAATVGITGNTITSVTTKPKLPLPSDASIIDGTGKFLMPGMTDAHIHFFQSGGLYTRPDGFDLRKFKSYEEEIEWTRLNMKDALKRYLQTGITSVIDVGSTHNFLKLRDKYREKSFAPAVFMTGPLLTTSEPAVFKNLGDNEPFSLMATEEEARQLVRKQLPYHPDFIKIWYILEAGKDKEESARKFLPLIKVVIDEAHKNNLKVAIHATERITAQLAAENGCDFLVHSVDDEVISDDFVKLLKAKNVTLCPTLVVYDGYRKTYGQLHEFSLNELLKSNPEQLGSLYDLKHLPIQEAITFYKNNVRNSKAVYDRSDSISMANLKKLADGGVRIAAGTDAGNIGTLHATSYMNELMSMKKSGLNNWQVLQSATINPSHLFDITTGSIGVNKKADLLLLEANPADDLKNLEKISLVINKGHIIKPDTLIKETALALVQRQLNAYNARNLEAFLEPYAEDVEVYLFPEKLQYKGKAEMRNQYAFFKNVPDLHCEIKERIIQGNTIIDKENVFGFGSKPVEATAIYQIENNKIKRVYFLQ